jgi:hypothetical protein
MNPKWLYAICTLGCFCSACSVVEQSSQHGFESGYYKLKGDSANMKNAYVDIHSDTIEVYTKKADSLQTVPLYKMTLTDMDGVCTYPYTFKKQSLDIDITSILFKYRPGKNGLPSEFTADFNAALYSGWRWDYYKVKGKKDPLNHCKKEIAGSGFDIGAFAGMGTTPVNAFTTQRIVNDDYSGMIFQYGIAGFFETNFVSFGIATGCDLLLTPDKKSWIYHNKLWLGFIIGIALN